MRITQARVSRAISTFEPTFKAKFGLADYTNPRRPAIFFGCYHGNREDTQAVATHRGLAVFVWGGTDAKQASCPTSGSSRQDYACVMANQNVRHVAISKSIVEDLRQLGVAFWFVPICPTDVSRFSCQPVGDAVYFYGSHNHPSRYGQHIFDEVRRKLGKEIRFIEGYSRPPNHRKASQMPAVYRSSLMGLRLTGHDGLSNTVIELGLMGRRCVWNGWAPNAIPWENADDVVETIREEKARAGRRYPKLARQVRQYVEIPDDWLHTEFYENWGA